MLVGERFFGNHEAADLSIEFRAIGPAQQADFSIREMQIGQYAPSLLLPFIRIAQITLFFARIDTYKKIGTITIKVVFSGNGTEVVSGSADKLLLGGVL